MKGLARAAHRAPARRRWRVVAAAVAVGALGVAPAAFPSSANAVVQSKSAVISFTSTLASGAQHSVTGTFTNNSQTSSVGSVSLTAPAGFTISEAHIVSGGAKGATTTFTATSVTFANLGVKSGGGQFSFSIAVTAPCAYNTTTWTAWTGTNPANPTVPVNQPTLTVTGSCHLLFTGDAASAEPLNAALTTASNGPLQVSIEDGANAVIASSSDTITVSITGSPAGVTLGGTSQHAATNGVATFSDLTIDASGQYTLTASDSTNASTLAATSSQFTIGNPSASSTSGCTDNCSATVTDGPQTTTVSGTGNTGGGQITLTLQPTDPGLNCGDTFIHAPFESSETSTNVGPTLDVTVTFTNTAAALDGSNVAVCYVQSSPYMWVDASGAQVGARTPRLLGQCMNADKDPSQDGEAAEFTTSEHERDAPCFYDISSNGTTVTEHLLIPGNDPGFH